MVKKAVESQVFEKNLQKETDKVTRQILTRDFLKKYLGYIKSQKPPQMDEGVTEYAAHFYAAIRQKAKFANPSQVACPVTVRTLESIIRLATAHAKLRLSKKIESDDIDTAVNLVNMSIFGAKDEPEEDEPEKKSKANKSRR